MQIFIYLMATIGCVEVIILLCVLASMSQDFWSTCEFCGFNFLIKKKYRSIVTHTCPMRCDEERSWTTKD